MIQEQKPLVTGKVLPEPKSISIDELIVMLSHLCEQRYHANSFYAKALGSQKRFEAIHKIRYELNQAKLMGDKDAALCILRLELDFHLLAANPTKQYHITFRQTVTQLMDACRFFLGRARQS